MFVPLPLVVVGLWASFPCVEAVLAPKRALDITHSRDISKCPGYKLSSVKENNFGLTAHLHLSGLACNAFGNDVEDLTIQVTYETTSRLHVNIFDTAKKQFTLPVSIFERPAPPSKSFKGSSDLVFNFDAAPFAFWITRRSQPHATPLFDTRISSLPKTPVAAFNATDNSTAFPAFPLVFEDRYVQVSSSLPLNTNIYGLGEVVASSGFRRNITETIQTMYARDSPDPLDQNIYGDHPIYLEHRFDPATKTSQSHGVFLLNPSPADILLATPPSANVSLVEYRMLGGTLDFYFLSGPTPNSVIEQYGALVGLPTCQPIWGFGFHLCRWGYQNIQDVRDQVASMRRANIPLEVQWTDIDLYHAIRDFTTDPFRFPIDQMKAFIDELHANNQHYISIVDPAIAKQTNSTDIYDPYLRGVEEKVFLLNPDGKEFIAQNWPGFVVFPDWFANNSQKWWTEALGNWSASGIQFDGIWLDMNEANTFCTGSCGTGANISNTSIPVVFPGTPGNLVLDYPECYNATLFGPSGNLTVNGTSTCIPDGASKALSSIHRRSLNVAKRQTVNLTAPPYAIHNANGPLSIHSLSPDIIHADGSVELDVHNLWGIMEEIATHRALQSIIPNKRPFIIGRSTFASAGKWTGHWLGDNFSLWSYMRYSITGVLQFQLFQIPFVGADACGFDGNADEELCNRWMQLAAFTPFYRNHNSRGAISQEPYRWDSVANASRTAIAIRYSLLPYWYTLYANSSTNGTPPIRALFYEFPNDPELFDVDSQFLLGRDILVTPVFEPQASTVSGIFPGGSGTIWRDWYTHDVVNASVGGPTTLPAPLGHINVHIRDGAALLLHSKPAYTIEETRSGPFSLLISQSSSGLAHGTVYFDDGVSDPPGPSSVLTVSATKKAVTARVQGNFKIAQPLEMVTVLGVTSKPSIVSLNGKKLTEWSFAQKQQKLVVSSLKQDLNGPLSLTWN